MKPNTNFTLTVNDISHIEKALYTRLAELSGLCQTPSTAKKILELSEETSEIYNLLGRIHNQKVWYRPKMDVYISG